eukprot:SAG31_NODE_689_length_12806_cov_5.358857_4_plen_72_part_00
MGARTAALAMERRASWGVQGSFQTLAARWFVPVTCSARCNGLCWHCHGISIGLNLVVIAFISGFFAGEGLR